METTILSQYEIERGKAIPSKNHAKVQRNLIFRLESNYRDQFDVLSEVSVDLPSGGVVPDVALYPPTPYDAFNDEIELTAPTLRHRDYLAFAEQPVVHEGSGAVFRSRYTLVLGY